MSPTTKPKKYILVEFPYPSGDGLHVGHVWGYTAGDVLARFNRMLGYEIIFPMGWDSFGLPAENYAIKTGQAPQITVKNSIKVFKKQMKDLNLSFDWDREIDTCDPDYYKWTQWIFVQLFKKGLAFKKKMPINWCPKCKTGLANEEVLANGTHERCGERVEQRMLDQWVLKITQYADRLYTDLDNLPWPNHIKVSQKNWIGKSEGADIKFVVRHSGESPQGTSPESVFNELKVFTTRPDTVFGVSAIVLAPEHPLVATLQIQQIADYVANCKYKSDFERTETNKEKTGVFTGLYATNPANGEKVPVWVADFVVPWYGNGAVMCVPAHDARDYDFAQKYNLPIKQVVVEGVLVNSGEFTGLTSEEAVKKIVAWFKKHNCGDYAVNYHLRDWVFSRQHYWGEPIPMVYCPKCTWVPVNERDLPLELPKIENYKPTEDGKSPLSKLTDWVNTTCPHCGSKAERETDTMPNWAGSNWYFLRYLDNKNDQQIVSKDIASRYMPVDIYLGGAEHTTLHLLYSRFIYKFLYDIGVVKETEPYTVRINRGIILGEDGSKMSKSLGNVINPDPLVTKVGSDALRLYELFLGPLEGTYAWNDSSLMGVKRFLDRVGEMSKFISPDAASLHEEMGLLTQRVTRDIRELKFHTAIAFLMGFVNTVYLSKEINLDEYRVFIKLLFPFAPSISEKLWKGIGEKNELTLEKWPQLKTIVLKKDFVDLIVQINGKTRGVLHLKIQDSASREVVDSMTKDDSKLKRYLEGVSVQKVIFVPEKLINFVI